jgi:F-type H+-transporting ATPase subunit delta
LININATELNVSITSNVKFSEDKLSSVRDNLSKKLDKQINIKNNVDKSLIGGVQLRIGNIIIDNSLSNKLIKLKNNLKNNHSNME